MVRAVVDLIALVEPGEEALIEEEEPEEMVGAIERELRGLRRPLRQVGIEAVVVPGVVGLVGVRRQGAEDAGRALPRGRPDDEEDPGDRLARAETGEVGAAL